MKDLEQRLCLSNRKELVLIDPRKVAYVEADGNYVHVLCRYNQHFHLNYSISNFLAMLCDNGCGQFVKIDRSHVANLQFITRVYPQKGILLLSDGETWSHQLELPQKTLKRLCVQIDEMFAENAKEYTGISEDSL